MNNEYLEPTETVTGLPDHFQTLRFPSLFFVGIIRPAEEEAVEPHLGEQTRLIGCSIKDIVRKLCFKKR